MLGLAKSSGGLNQRHIVGNWRITMASYNEEYKLPEFDELTHRKILPKSELKDGHYYVGRCRNASVARWNATENCFYHWRTKFDSVFTETISHPDDDDHYDVFRVLRELKDPPFDIPFDVAPVYKDNNKEELSEEFLKEVWCTCDQTYADGKRHCLVHMDLNKAIGEGKDL
jgi:hypothetical protein